MALISYTPRTPPTTNLRTYLFEELRAIQLVIATVSGILAALNGAKIEVGPPDSAGAGYRTLRIPN